MFDLNALTQTVAAQGKTAHIVIAAFEGSSPREVGAAMLVWADGQSGTIGGGALEWEAICRARRMLALGGRQVNRIPLGPALGQCCGGAVTLLTEVYDAQSLPQPEHGVIARSTDGREMPLAVKRLLDRARAQGNSPSPQLLQGWFVEPLARPRRDIWLWGAGHVGRAIAEVLAPLPDVALTWVDIAEARFPNPMPVGARMLCAADPAELVGQAPANAEHLVLTFSHALDLELCHRLLGHGFNRLGLIGSETKWARFRSRLAALGHGPQSIGRIDCPIGDPSLGKHPQAIAIGVAAALLKNRNTNATRQGRAG